MLQQPVYNDLFVDLDGDIETLDFLSLRHDQMLEYAKEYNSIIPEPLGSRLRTRKTSSKVSHTRNPRPMWKQPCKVAAPETYSLQWQHVNLSQLEAFPLTLRSIDSSSPSRKRDQPDYAYSEHAKPSESLAAPVLKSAIMGGSQQNRHSPTQGGSHMVGPLKCSSNVMSKHSHAVNSKDRKADEASIMQHHTGLHTSATPACRADALGKHANCQHAKLTTPGRPSSLHLHQSVYTQHPVEQSDRQAAKHLAARGGFDSQHPKKASSSPTDTSQQPTDRPQSKTKPSHVQCPKQPTCNQASSRLSGRPGNVVKASPAPADDGSKGLQRQETLLGNWVRWAKPTADMVAGKTGSGSTAGLVPRTPPQPKESHRPSPDPSRQSEAQPQPAFQRHVMPCTTKAVSYSSCADVQQSNCPCSPCRQYQAHSPPRQPQQQQMQRCSSKSNAVLNNVVHQPGCDLLQRCNVDDAVGNGRWQPSVRYCLSSGEPAVTAGVWEEQATRQWLQELSLGLTASEESAPLLDNQLRNGVLLCDLAGVLEGRIVWGVDRQPKSLQRARANIRAGLGQLGMLTAQTCPKGLVHEVEHILQGRQASIWGLLNHLRVTHPAAKVVPLHLKAQMAHGMGIQASHPLKPDRCAAMVSEDHAAAESAPVQHVVSIGPHGHIRCSVPGYASPRQHTASSRDCNHSAQQLHPAQASFKKGKPTKQSCEYHQRETLTVSLVNQPCVLAAPSRAVSPQRSQRVHAPCKEPASVDATSSTPYVRMVAIGPGYSRPEATAPVECHQQSSSQQRQQQHQQSHAAPERCPEPVAASPAGRKAALAQLRMARRRQQGGVVAKQKVQECMAARDRPGGGQQWSSRRKASQQPASLIDLELVSWAQSKGLTQLSPGMLLEPSFADGRLLCQLVELLARCTLPGIERHTPSIAASRHNIAKAMAELKKRPSMPLQHLWQAGNIVNSEPGCIQALLNDIARAYK